MSTYIDLHVIQSVPFANLNRDDTGAPKTAVYGGVDRIRVSSQSWKRAARTSLEERLAKLTGNDRAQRTLNYVEELAPRLVAAGMTEDAATAAAKVAFKNPDKPFPKDKTTESGGDGDGESSRVLMFLTESQYDDLATYTLAHGSDFAATSFEKKDEAEFKKAHRKNVSTILADPRGVVRLLGRMIAHLPNANTDSAVQVAHAITTHAQISEPDFLTAVDDRPEPDQGSGAAHMLSAEYASGTFYRYANINVDTLARNGVLDPNDLKALVGEFARAFVLSLPSGKSTSTAANTRPVFVGVQVTSSPQNLVTAFEKPVRAGEKGYVISSVEALAAFADRSQSVFGEAPSWAGHLAVVDAEPGSSFGDAYDLDGLLAGLVAAI